MAKYVLFCFFVISVCAPIALHEVLTVYSEPIPSEIGYKYWEYKFSIIHLSVIAVGFVLNVNYFYKCLIYIILPTIFYNILSSLITGFGIFVTSHYHMILILLTGIGFAAISHTLIEKMTFHRVFSYLYAVFFTTQLLRLMLNQHTDGRFAMQGLGLGETALFNALGILYILSKSKSHTNDLFLAIVSCISLLVTGQRTIIAILSFYIILRYIIMIFTFRSGQRKFYGFRRALIYIQSVLSSQIIVFCILSLMYLAGIKFDGINFIERIMSTIYASSENLSSEYTSVGGRSLSFLVGVQLLLDFPFGIGTDFYQLQVLMQERGYPTFPHNGMMNVYLLMSPVIMLAVIVAGLRYARFLRKGGFLLGSIPYFCLIVWSVWGGPLLNPLLVWIFMFFLTSNLLVKGNHEKRNQ